MPTLTPELYAALILFAFVSSITPGPNNAMLMASGANFGLRRTLPHLLGVTGGFSVMVAAAGLGLGGLFTAYPAAHTLLKVLGAAYLVYLAGKIAVSPGVGGTRPGSGRPMSFLQAAAFQWVNPKALIMALSAVTTYCPARHYLANVLAAAVIFGAVNGPCVSCWAMFGVGLRRFLDRPKMLRAFNLAMAALLLLSLYPLAAELWSAMRR